MHGVSIDRLQIASSMLEGLEDFTVAAGLNFDSLARAVGLENLDPANEEQFVNLDHFAKFLEIASILTGDESFGLRFAGSQSMVSSGALSFALNNASTVRNALQTLVKYAGTRLDVAHAEFVMENDRAIVDWGFSPLLVRRWQLCDYSAGAIMRRMTRIVEQNWRPLGVELMRPAPRNRDAHRRILGRSIEFGQRTNSIAFPLSILSVPVVDANPALHQMSRQLLERVLRERVASADLVTSVKEEIILALPSEDGVHLRRVARRLGLSTRSLQRHLSELQTSFQDLVDDTRRTLAARYLERLLPDLFADRLSAGLFGAERVHARFIPMVRPEARHGAARSQGGSGRNATLVIAIDN